RWGGGGFGGSVLAFAPLRKQARPDPYAHA
ncbi:MAG: hypothetical protein AMXMBFR78_17710, partial [Rubrivivax sp.]